MNVPVVSICLPTLNALQFLEPRMKSIMDQTFSDWELIVCDSFSDDGTWEFFQQFKDDRRVRLYQVPKDGLYAGWNECLRRCRGEYIYIATADDTMSLDFLEKMIGALAECYDTDIALCDLDFLSASGEVIECPRFWKGREFYGEWCRRSHLRNGKTEFILHSALGIMWWSITSILFNRSLLDRVGLFRTDRGSGADEEWEMRAALASNIVYVPERMATWRIHADQATAKRRSIDRTNLLCLESVLSDESCIPDDWKNIPLWMDKILHIQKMEYYSSIGLFRHVLKTNPKQFLSNVCYAALHEPMFLASQVGKGFAWDDKFSPDPFIHVHSLLKEFDCEWPPVEL